MSKTAIITLGCKVNQYESEQLAKKIGASHGLVIADTYIVNTCAVTSYAEKKSRMQIAKIKKLNPNAKIIVCGCAAINNPNQFKNVEVQKLSADKLDISTKNQFEKNDLMHPEMQYLKVQDGCNNFCSYCIVPHLRGRSCSRDVNAILNEAKNIKLSAEEIVVIGIDLSSFNNFETLLRGLSSLPQKIRLSSLEPGLINEQFLNWCKAMPNFIPHFHLSLQSGSDKVLKAMNRHYTASDYIRRVELIRKIFPNSTITTDVICGFPTETEDDFKQTCELIKTVKFDSIHIFQFSPRSGTPAAKLPLLQNNVVTERAKKLKELQEQIKKG